jgi:hypothetical protein
MSPSFFLNTASRLSDSLLVLLVVLAVIVPTLSGQTRPTVDAEIRAAVVTELGTLLRDRYVHADVGITCADELDGRLAGGDFDTVSDAGDFCQILTRILQDISHDKHLHVDRGNPNLPVETSIDTDDSTRRRREQGRRRNFGFEQILRLDGNVGVLDLRGFMPVEDGGETAIAAMNFLSTSDAIIIDLRQNGGGDPEMVQLISSYFFDEPTHLNSLYWRADDRTDEFWTHEDVTGQRMGDVPLFVLTSRRTFSAAEEFTYNLKTQKRATIIGETTGGGAHPGDVHSLPGQLTVFMPEGRAINPITGTNWEGTGVEPDIETDANSAFEQAVQLALEAAEKHSRARSGSS